MGLLLKDTTSLSWVWLGDEIRREAFYATVRVGLNLKIPKVEPGVLGKTSLGVRVPSAQMSRAVLGHEINFLVCQT